MWSEEVKCPHCGNIEEEWYELGLVADDKNEVQCGWCDQTYHVHVKVTYEFRID